MDALDLIAEPLVGPEEPVDGADLELIDATHSRRSRL